MVRLVAVAVFVLHAMLFLGWIQDDAYISFRYAWNLVSGWGLSFNPGAAPVEGYTNFAWTMLAAGALAIGVRPEALLPLVGLAAGAGVVLVAVTEARRMAEEEGRGHRLAGLPAGLLLALVPGLPMYAVSGLETAPFTLLLVLGGIAAVRGQSTAFALLSAGAFLFRPEAALLGVAGTALLSLRGIRRAAAAAAVMAVPVAAYLAWKMLTFGGILPNTAVAKPPDVGRGLSYVVAGLLPAAGVIAAAAAGAWRGGVRGGRAGLLWLWVVQTAGVVAEGGDWMPVGRMLVPAMPWLAVAADRSLLDLVSPGPARRRAVAVALALGAAVLPVKGLVDSHELRGRMAFSERSEQTRAVVARKLYEEGIRKVALVDIGLFGYAAPAMEILDLGGLTDPVIAAAPGRHLDKAPPEAYLAGRDPDAILIDSAFDLGPDAASGRLDLRPMYGVERAVVATRWFGERYRYDRSFDMGGVYTMHLFVRR